MNRVNMRKEFFRATPAEVRDVLARELTGTLLTFNDEAEAAEWRQSQTGPTAPTNDALRNPGPPEFEGEGFMVDEG